METVSAYKELEYSAGFASRPGRGRRHNEDDYTIFTTKEIGGFGETTVQTVVIADGSGGGARGKVASRMAVQTVYQLVINNETTPIQQRLIQAVYEANGAIFRQALLEPQLANMRASLIAVAVSAGTLHIARVGDCQAFVIRGGLAYRVTSPTTIPQAVNMAYNPNGDAPALNWEEGNGLLGRLTQGMVKCARCRWLIISNCSKMTLSLSVPAASPMQSMRRNWAWLLHNSAHRMLSTIWLNRSTRLAARKM